MNTVLTIHRGTYDTLRTGKNRFRFLEVSFGLVRVPVVLTNVVDNGDTLTLTIEPLYQQIQGIPNTIEVKGIYGDCDVEPIMDEDKINAFLVHYLQTKIKFGDEFTRDNALLQAFIHTFNK